MPKCFLYPSRFLFGRCAFAPPPQWWGLCAAPWGCCKCCPPPPTRRTPCGVLPAKETVCTTSFAAAQTVPCACQTQGLCKATATPLCLPPAKNKKHRRRGFFTNPRCFSCHRAGCPATRPPIGAWSLRSNQSQKFARSHTPLFVPSPPASGGYVHSLRGVRSLAPPAKRRGKLFYIKIIFAKNQNNFLRLFIIKNGA